MRPALLRHRHGRA